MHGYNHSALTHLFYAIRQQFDISENIFEMWLLLNLSLYYFQLQFAPNDHNRYHL